MENFDFQHAFLLGEMMPYPSEEKLYIEIIVNNGRSQYFNPDYWYEIVKLAREKSTQGHEILYAPAYRLKDKGSERSEDQNIIANCFWLDIKSPDTSLSFEKQYASIQRIFGEFMVCLSHYRRLTPTFVLSSGYAFHILFLMDKTYLAPFGDLIEIQSAMTKMVKGIEAAPITGLIHLPGTFNYQDKDNPRKVEVIQDYRHLYSYEWETGFEPFDRDSFEKILENYK